VQTEFLIDGEFTHFTTKTYSISRPADSSRITDIPDAGAEDVNRAIAAAKDAYAREWKNYDPNEREKLFWKWAELLESRSEEIGKIEGADAGKNSLGCAKNVRWDAGLIRFFAGWINKNYGDVLEFTDTYLNYVVKEPIGVVASMVPFNGPVRAAVNKLAPALAAGNTVVLKCSDDDPLATLKVVEAAHDAGFPRGAVNVIAGKGPASGKTLVSHPDVRLVSFTGSVAVGKEILRASAEHMKRTAFELGGKSPLIVFPDADLEKAAREAVTDAFVYQGQMCCAVSRILVHEAIRKEFAELLKEYTSRYTPAYPEEQTGETPTIGPLFNERQYKTVEKYVEIARKDGNLLIGGKRIVKGKFGKAYYFEPTIFEFENDESRVCREEIFGPLVSVIPFAHEDDAVQIANNVPYGLSASVWSKDLGLINRMTRRLEVGTVWANCYFAFNVHAPWGGFKESGLRKEFGKYAMEHYFEYKNIWLKP
jgi:acyl-CoA reductase-like NAD-dependent aldehyde dehydrogenase